LLIAIAFASVPVCVEISYAFPMLDDIKKHSGPQLTVSVPIWTGWIRWRK
jgi:hypothetical protein